MSALGARREKAALSIAVSRHEPREIRGSVADTGGRPFGVDFIARYAHIDATASIGPMVKLRVFATAAGLALRSSGIANSDADAVFRAGTMLALLVAGRGIIFIRRSRA